MSQAARFPIYFRATVHSTHPSQGRGLLLRMYFLIEAFSVKFKHASRVRPFRFYYRSYLVSRPVCTSTCWNKQSVCFCMQPFSSLRLCVMFSISSILLCTLTISKCIAQAETPLFSNTDIYDPSVFLDSSSSVTNPENLEGTLQTGSTDSTMAFLDDDENDASSLFAGSNERCSLETSQLSSTLRRRGAVPSQCDVPKGESDLNAPTINSKIAPFIDIQTMELKAICPSQYKTPYSIAVCSSGDIGDIVAYPPDIINFGLFWAQQSEPQIMIFWMLSLWYRTINEQIQIFFCSSHHRRSRNVYQSSIHFLLSGMAWRRLWNVTWSTGTYKYNFYYYLESVIFQALTMKFQVPDRGQGRFCQLLDPFDYFYLSYQVRFESPWALRFFWFLREKKRRRKTLARSNENE